MDCVIYSCDFLVAYSFSLHISLDSKYGSELESNVKSVSFVGYGSAYALFQSLYIYIPTNNLLYTSMVWKNLCHRTKKSRIFIYVKYNSTKLKIVSVGSNSTLCACLAKWSEIMCRQCMLIQPYTDISLNRDYLCWTYRVFMYISICMVL